MSAFELARRITHPVASKDTTVRADLREARSQSQVRRKLELILKLKAGEGILISVGDLSKVFQKHGQERGGIFLSLRPLHL